MNRSVAVLLVAVAVGMAIPGASLGATALISVDSVSVSPQQPVPGETVTVTPTIKNLKDSDGVFVINGISLTDGTTQYTRETELGATLSPGSTTEVPLTATFDSTGTKQLTIKVWGELDEKKGSEQLNYPVTINVGDYHPRVSVRANDSVVGARTTGSVTISNGLDSDIQNVEVSVEGTGVSVSEDEQVYAKIESGESKTVDYTVTHDSVGTHTVNATVTYMTSGGTTRSISETTNVTTSRTGGQTNVPQVSFRANDSVVGVGSTATVTIANGLDSEMSNVEVTVSGSNVTLDSSRRVYATLSSGTKTNATFTYTPTTEGTQELVAMVNYTTESGASRTIRRVRTVETDSFGGNVSLLTSTSTVDGTTRLTVEVVNRDDTEIEDITIEASGPDATVGQSILDSVPPGETRSVTFNVTDASEEPEVTVDADYAVGDRSYSTSTTTTVTGQQTTIDLTGIEITREKDKLHVTGTASNLGTREAKSVVVSVVDTDSVDPAYPNREFFVGSVPASDFVSFDLYARVDAGTSAIPVKIEYLVDGESHERRLELDISSVGTASESVSTQNQLNAGLLAPVALGGIVVLAVGGIIVRAWRNSRDGD